MATWEAFRRDDWRLRHAGLGTVTGVDTQRAGELLRRMGHDPQVVDQLLDACERGMVRALIEKDTETEDGPED